MRELLFLKSSLPRKEFRRDHDSDKFTPRRYTHTHTRALRFHQGFERSTKIKQRVMHQKVMKQQNVVAFH